MAGSPSNRAIRQLHRLFNFGAVGTMSDAQLLEWFVSRSDETAKAAFEELVIRHGPMVLRVCRGVLHDTHDADDAFQAVFLVLASRARSIRRGEAVASWLYGVAHHVAARARRSAARQRRLNQRVAQRTSESDRSAVNDPDWEILHQEIDGLPERLRAPVVLCYLKGQNYAVAARQLGLSPVTIRGRLARARERLRSGLIGRGVTIPAGLLAAALSAKSQAAVPGPLVHSTVRIALEFVSGNAAAILARGVLNSMMMNQLKVAAVLLLLCIGGSYWAWHAAGGASDDKGQAESRRVADKTSAPAPVAAAKSQAKAPTTTYRFTGAVKVEGTGEPIAGAKLQIESGDIARPNTRIVETGADGRLATDLRPGNLRIWPRQIPVGYLFTNSREFFDGLVAGSAEPVIHREYHVRKGAIWKFWFARGVDQEPVPGFVGTTNSPELFQAQADPRGRALLTLPTEGRKVALSVSESSPLSISTELYTGFLAMNLEWEADFRPDEVNEISRSQGNDRRFRLIDSNAKSATLQAPDSITPVSENGKLVIRVALPHLDSKDFAALMGQVLDDQGRPIAGAHVALVGLRRLLSDEPRQQTTTDSQGRYRLR
jgi:RNA polymerase sigma factor (sigma-70 family)